MVAKRRDNRGTPPPPNPPPPTHTHTPNGHCCVILSYFIIKTLLMSSNSQGDTQEDVFPVCSYIWNGMHCNIILVWH